MKTFCNLCLTIETGIDEIKTSSDIKKVVSHIESNYLKVAKGIDPLYNKALAVVTSTNYGTLDGAVFAFKKGQKSPDVVNAWGEYGCGSYVISSRAKYRSLYIHDAIELLAKGETNKFVRNFSL